jgi:hypothetical protein
MHTTRASCPSAATSAVDFDDEIGPRAAAGWRDALMEVGQGRSELTCEN